VGTQGILQVEEHKMGENPPNVPRSINFLSFAKVVLLPCPVADGHHG
jgi:hypothetical protein